MEHVNANGTTMPAIGFGTYELEPGDAQAMTAHALQTGYRHIDTAQAYNNEEAVGAGIRQSGVARGDIFLTTKIWMDDYADGDLQRAARRSLDRLDTDYVDLLLLHWPNPDISLAETMGALNDAKDQGLARNIGISNFTTPLIEKAVEESKAHLATNQVEYHPYLDQSTVKSMLGDYNMILTAYSPLARGEVFKDATLNRIAGEHGKNAGQVALRWLLQQTNVCVIPRSTKPEHVESNFEVFDFELTTDQVQDINGLHRRDGRMISPSFAPEWDAAGY